MSEEEKKAIETTKVILKEWQKIVDIEDPTEREIEMTCYAEEMPFSEMKTLLNLIEKQQKEIEREKQYNDFYKNLCDKQQEEIKKLKEIEQAHKEENEKLRGELEKEKEKNKKQFDILCKYEDKLEFYENNIFDELGKVINLDKFRNLDKISVKGKKYIAQDVLIS